MPLKLSLKPGEKFVLNGAVVQNGDRRTTLVLQNKVSVLRERDIMQVEEANSPARRVYFPIMMMYIDEHDIDNWHVEFVHRLKEFMSVIVNKDVLSDCVEISRLVAGREFYKALTLCRKLIDYEDERLAHVAASVSSSGAAGGIPA
ncbi:MAG: flagellar biosynthesis repressor FlbT [Pseudomonadota bacterium]|jgi:flagellar protein FlbT